MSIEAFASNWMTEEHSMVYDSALKMFQSWESKDEQWRENGMIDREAWNEAGEMGFLCASISLVLKIRRNHYCLRWLLANTSLLLR